MMAGDTKYHQKYPADSRDYQLKAVDDSKISQHFCI